MYIVYTIRFGIDLKKGEEDWLKNLRHSPFFCPNIDLSSISYIYIHISINLPSTLLYNSSRKHSFFLLLPLLLFIYQNLNSLSSIQLNSIHWQNEFFLLWKNSSQEKGVSRSVFPLFIHLLYISDRVDWIGLDSIEKDWIELRKAWVCWERELFYMLQVLDWSIDLLHGRILSRWTNGRKTIPSTTLLILLQTLPIYTLLAPTHFVLIRECDNF